MSRGRPEYGKKCAFVWYDLKVKVNCQEDGHCDFDVGNKKTTRCLYHCPECFGGPGRRAW